MLCEIDENCSEQLDLIRQSLEVGIKSKKDPQSITMEAINGLIKIYKKLEEVALEDDIQRVGTFFSYLEFDKHQGMKFTGHELKMVSQKMLKKLEQFEIYFSEPYSWEECYLLLKQLYTDAFLLSKRLGFFKIERRIYDRLINGVAYPQLKSEFVKILPYYQFDSLVKYNFKLKYFLNENSKKIRSAFNTYLKFSSEFEKIKAKLKEEKVDSFVNGFEIITMKVTIFCNLNNHIMALFSSINDSCKKVEDYYSVTQSLLSLDKQCSDILDEIKALKKIAAPERKVKKSASNKSRKSQRNTSKRALTIAPTIILTDDMGGPCDEAACDEASCDEASCDEASCDEASCDEASCDEAPCDEVSYDKISFTKDMIEALNDLTISEPDNPVSTLPSTLPGVVDFTPCFEDYKKPDSRNPRRVTIDKTNQGTQNPDIQKIVIKSGPRKTLEKIFEGNLKIKYEEVVVLVEHALLGTVHSSTGSSSRKFLVNGMTICFHQRHGRDRKDYLDPRCIADIKQMLITLGITPDTLDDLAKNQIISSDSDTQSALIADSTDLTSKEPEQKISANASRPTMKNKKKQRR